MLVSEVSPVTRGAAMICLCICAEGHTFHRNIATIYKNIRPCHTEGHNPHLTNTESIKAPKSQNESPLCVVCLWFI